jgi:hypothetical protein
MFIELNPLDVLVAAIASGVLLAIWMRAFLRITLLNAFLTCLVINGVIAGWVVIKGLSAVFPALQGSQRVEEPAAMTLVVSLFVTINLAVAMIARVYRCAVLQKASPEERTAGVIGVRAWLSPMNVITAVCLSIAAYMSLECSITGTLIIGFSLLLAYPLMNTLLNQPASETSPPQAPNDERRRVLAMVEAGKITAEDAAELLGALAQSQVIEIEASQTISIPRRIVLAGAVVLLVGFFLPWFTVNESQVMHDAVNGMQQAMQQNFSQATQGYPYQGQTTLPPPIFQSPPGNGEGTAVPTRNVLQITLHGGDVRDGLGWIALAAGLCVAGLPFFWTRQAENTNYHRSIAMGAMAVGTVAMLYLLSNSINSITTIEPGFMLALVACALLWTGTIREHVTGTQRIQPKLLATA